MPPESAEPIFVGGTGRSGTTVVGQLIGARSDVALVPIELRFHVERGGLADLAAGTITIDQFAQRLRRKWYERPPNSSGPRGLHVIATRPQMRQALRRLRAGYEDDPWGACGTFLDDVIRPFCREQGTPTWVEMTPPNAQGMDALCQMFPRARVVHMVRDGRDVAASVARRSWGPNDFDSALVWWADRLAAIQHASERADPARVHTARLESLVGPERHKHFATLVEFLGREPDAGMQQFFESQMTPERSHPGSWRSGLDPAEQARINDLYDEQVSRLAAMGVTIPPVE